MKTLVLAGAIALAIGSSLAGAETTSATSTSSTTTTVEPKAPEYSSSRTERHVDQDGNMIKKSQTYNSADPASGKSSSHSSTTVVSPDGSASSVERERTTGRSYDGSTAVEKRTTTTTVR